MSRSFSSDDVFSFGRASGDWNPVHYPDRFAAVVRAEEARWRSSPLTASLPLPNTGIFRFPAPIVHGMLTASLIGTLFATHLPGAIYMQQSIHFRAPVFYDEMVTARIEVIKVDRKRVTCRTVVEKADKEGKTVLVVEGEAKVMVESLQQ
jgi:3-hydroxybutyryl-CoA dehydratase